MQHVNHHGETRFSKDSIKRAWYLIREKFFTIKSTDCVIFDSQQLSVQNGNCRQGNTWCDGGGSKVKSTKIRRYSFLFCLFLFLFFFLFSLFLFLFFILFSFFSWLFSPYSPLFLISFSFLLFTLLNFSLLFSFLSKLLF